MHAVEVPGASIMHDRRNESDELMTVADAGRILGVSTDMVRLLERDGRLPCMRTVRGVRLFRRADVVQLAEERRTNGKRKKGVQ
jgi:excisionase family DNA binding protein